MESGREENSREERVTAVVFLDMRESCGGQEVGEQSSLDLGANVR